MKTRLFSAVLLAAATTLAAADDDDIRAKLAELEKRLAALEASRQQTESQEKKPQTVEVEQLRRQLDVLSEEIEKLRSGEVEQISVTEERARSLGVGPSASAVYRTRQGVSLAGYGEMLYQNFSKRNQSDQLARKGSQLDFLRAILYAGYRFDDRFLFNSEIEFEHASTDKSGSASVEFAYVDYLANDNLTLRGGMMLVPMGLVNEFHEPNVFLGARRTETESKIIPSTWRENGFGVLGSYGMIDFRAYVINGLDATGFSADGIRGGRQKGSKAKATDLAFVGRLDVHPTPGVFFGGSIYRGDSSQGQFELENRTFSVNTTIGELHGQVHYRGWDVRGLFAKASLDNVDLLNTARNLEGTDAVAESMVGGYLQVGYNLLSRSSEQSELTPYYRFEKLNTHDEVPLGFSFDPARDRIFHTFGFEFKPIYNIVIKSDFQWLRNDARSGVNQFNLALGYAF